MRYLGKKALTNIDTRLSKYNLPGLVSNLTSSAINKLDRKINGKGFVKAGKGFTLFISNEDMNNIKQIIKSLENSGVLIDGFTETVKDEIKNKKVDCSVLVPLAASLVQPVISSVVKGISGRRVRRGGKGYMVKSF